MVSFICKIDIQDLHQYIFSGSEVPCRRWDNPSWPCYLVPSAALWTYRGQYWQQSLPQPLQMAGGSQISETFLATWRKNGEILSQLLTWHIVGCYIHALWYYILISFIFMVNEICIKRYSWLYIDRNLKLCWILYAIISISEQGSNWKYPHN